MQQGVQAREWRRYGYGGPPEPWSLGAQRNLDRLSTSYFLEVLDGGRAILAGSAADDELRGQIEELFATATRHKHEIDYTLRHWATPIERARVEERLGSLMRISRRFRAILENGPGSPTPHPLRAA
jgi:hypothetical protein